jgi:hypothetical protein
VTGAVSAGSKEPNLDLRLFPQDSSKSTASRSKAKERRRPEEVGVLPVEGWERFTGDGGSPWALDEDGIRARLSQTLRSEGRKGENALIQELERLIPEVRSFVDRLRATPSGDLLNDFVQQLDAAGHGDQAEGIAALDGEAKKTVADGLKDTLLRGSQAHLAECEAWLADTREERRALEKSAAKQWGRVLKNAWAPQPKEMKFAPDAISTLFKKDDWKNLSNVQAGARYGNLGDLLASTVGVAHAMASGNPGDLVRLLITGSGVSGGYVNDKAWGMKLDDPEAEQRSNLGKAVRPLQHPDRAGFLAYMPAALAFMGSGVWRNATDPALAEVLGQTVNVAGLADVAGGASLLAGFGAVVLMNDPRTGEVAERIPAERLRNDPDTGPWLDAESGEAALKPGLVPDLRVVDRNTKKEHSIGLHTYLAIPSDRRPELKEVMLRKPVLTDRLNGAKNWTIEKIDAVRQKTKAPQTLRFESAEGEVGATRVDRSALAKARDWGRFQIFAGLSSLTTGMGWLAFGDRSMALAGDLPEVMAGFAEGPESPGFWRAALQVGTVAASAAMAWVYTKANISFARNGYENKKKEEEAWAHGHLDPEAYERAKEAGELSGPSSAEEAPRERTSGDAGSDRKGADAGSEKQGPEHRRSLKRREPRPRKPARGNDSEPARV